MSDVHFPRRRTRQDSVTVQYYSRVRAASSLIFPIIFHDFPCSLACPYGTPAPWCTSAICPVIAWTWSVRLSSPGAINAHSLYALTPCRETWKDFALASQLWPLVLWGNRRSDRRVLHCMTSCLFHYQISLAHHRWTPPSPKFNGACPPPFSSTTALFVV